VADSRYNVTQMKQYSYTTATSIASSSSVV
jgi:hypothetical protein